MPSVRASVPTICAIFVDLIFIIKMRRRKLNERFP
jgi:hypothetical protein